MHRQLVHSEKTNLNIQHDLVVIAEQIHHPQNLGMIFRVCEAMGVKHIYLLNCTVDMGNRKFQKPTRNTEKHVTFSAHQDAKILFEELRTVQYKILALEITTESKDLRNFTFEQGAKYALLVGSEKNGVSQESLTAVDDCIHIPMFGTNLSMNVMTSLSIGLFEAVRQMS